MPSPNASTKQPTTPLARSDLGHGQGEVHSGDALGQRASHMDAVGLGHQDRDGLPQRGGLGLDAADTPAEHADAVDGGGVGVGAHHGVEIGQRGLPALPRCRHDAAGEQLDVQLVADTGGGRQDVDVVQGGLGPLQEAVALLVAPELDALVLGGSLGAARDVADDRVVDDEVAMDERVHQLGVAPQGRHGLAHGGEVGHDRHAGKVLEQHARGHERHLGPHLPRKAGLDDGCRRLLGRRSVALQPHDVLEQDLKGIGKPLGPCDLLHGDVSVGLLADGKLGKQLKRVSHGLPSIACGHCRKQKALLAAGAGRARHRWCLLTGSNRRPFAPEANALSAELRRRWEIVSQAGTHGGC